MKRLVSLGLLALLVTPAVTAAPAAGSDWMELCRATMWAGQHTDAGEVVVSKSGDFLYVEYRTEGEWTLDLVHLHIAARMEDVPQKNGNPIPGQFDYQGEADGQRFAFRIHLGELPQGCDLVFAAHADVIGEGGTCDGAATIVLPAGPVQVCVAPGEPDAFFRFLLSGAGTLDGEYDGWCIDLGGHLDYFGCYDEVYMVGSWDPLAGGLIEVGENWSYINYLLNKVAEYRANAVHYMVIQWAFWKLAQPSKDPGIFPYYEAMVQEVLDDVYANGKDFVPAPGQLVAVALVHEAAYLQETIIGIPVPPCTPGEGETAWAGDREFPGKNWARYFVCPTCRD